MLSLSISHSISPSIYTCIYFHKYIHIYMCIDVCSKKAGRPYKLVTGLFEGGAIEPIRELLEDQRSRKDTPSPPPPHGNPYGNLK